LKKRELGGGFELASSPPYSPSKGMASAERTSPTT